MRLVRWGNGYRVGLLCSTYDPVWDAGYARREWGLSVRLCLLLGVFCRGGENVVWYGDVRQWTEVPGVDKLHENLTYGIRSARSPSCHLVLSLNASMSSLYSAKMVWTLRFPSQSRVWFQKRL